MSQGNAQGQEAGGIRGVCPLPRVRGSATTSPWAEERSPPPIPAAHAAGTSGGCRSHEKERPSFAPAWVRGCAGCTDDARAAEVVVARRPRGARRSLPPRGGRDRAPSRRPVRPGATRPAGMDADGRSTPAFLDGEPLVEDFTGEHRPRRAVRRRVPPAAPPARTSWPSARSAIVRRHHALHPPARARAGPAQEIRLAEHRVQVEVETGEEVAGAETEARRDRAGVAVTVDRDEVRRVRLGTVARECAHERDEALGGSSLGEPGKRGERRPAERGRLA